MLLCLIVAHEKSLNVMVRIAAEFIIGSQTQTAAQWQS
ncbi:hypothetical protein NOR53_1290 [gamma proteobacterium NOR5-3]|nr:hypothetical protein NOR53_1290 [gamma proteobacterium NOR5-3]